MKKFINYFVLALAIFLISNQEAKAANISLYASTTSVTVGSSVVITVKSPDVDGKFSITSSNTNVLSGGSSSDWIEGQATFMFYANNAGSATILLQPIDAADHSGVEFTESRSVTINVVPKRVVVLSTDNTLGSLSVDGTSISPEFNSDNLEYTVMLDPGTTKININASANDSGASVSGTGEFDVEEGDNNFDIVVTAEDGSSRTYKVKATVKEYNPVIVKIDSQEYTVVRNKKNLTPPDNYEEKIIKIGDEEIPAYKGSITNYTLVALKDSKGNQNWYIKDKDNYKLYNEYKFGSTTLYVQELAKKDIPTGYKKSSIKYNKEKIVAYKLNKKSNYALLYGMNVETGKVNIYMYDKEENTVQIYNDEYFNKVNNENNLYLKIAIGTSICLVVSIISTIVIVFRKKKED